MRARHKRSGGERRSKFFCRKFSVVSARGKKQGRGPSRFLATLVSKSDFRTGSTKLWLFSKSVRRSVSEPSGHPGPPAKIAPGKGRAESGLITRMGAWKWSLQRRTPAITHAETAERYRPSEYAERGRRHYSRGGAEARRGRDGSASSAPPRLRVIQSFEFSRLPAKELSAESDRLLAINLQAGSASEGRAFGPVSGPETEESECVSGHAAGG